MEFRGRAPSAAQLYTLGVSDVEILFSPGWTHRLGACAIPDARFESYPPDTEIHDVTGVPVPPGGTLYRKAGAGYLFAAPLSFEECETWYRDTMLSAGWSSVTKYRGAKAVIGGGPTVTLEFRRQKEHVSVLLVYSVEEQQTMIMIVRLAS